MATPILSKITMTTRMELEPCKKREKREFSKVLRRVFKLTLTKIFICELHFQKSCMHSFEVLVPVGILNNIPEGSCIQVYSRLIDYKALVTAEAACNNFLHTSHYCYASRA